MKERRTLGRGAAIVGAGMSHDKGLDPAYIDALYLGNFSNDFFYASERFECQNSNHL